MFLPQRALFNRCIPDEIDVVHLSFLVGFSNEWMNEFILFNILKQQILMNIKLAFPWVWTFDFCISIHGLSIARYYIQYIRLQSCSCRRNGRFSKRKEQKSRKRCKRKSYVSISWRKWKISLEAIDLSDIILRELICLKMCWCILIKIFTFFSFHCQWYYCSTSDQIQSSLFSFTMILS